jgi:hypothetical protein
MLVRRQDRRIVAILLAVLTATSVVATGVGGAVATGPPEAATDPIAGDLASGAVGVAQTSAEDVQYRVNAGGGSVSATAGDWTADASGSQFSSSGITYPADGLSAGDVSNPTGAPSEVFLTERYGDHSWSFDVTSGESYEVRLYFAEIYHGVSTSSAVTGDRVFDVSVEGNQVLNDYDIVAETGGAAAATDETFEVTPSDGTLDVSFTTETDNAKISAIEVVDAAPEPGVISGPSGVSFGTNVVDSSTTKTVTLVNEGESSDAASITVDGVSVTGTDASDFSTDFSGSTTLAPGETLDVPVTFTPSSAQTTSATLEVSHDAPNTASPLTVDLSGEGSSSVPIGFGHTELSGFSTGNPTSIDWGPDGRLYVSNQNGEVFALTVQRNGEDDYEVTDTETITAIQDIPNHNDDGSFGGPDNERQVTGLRVGGTADAPVVYVTSSDPRISVENDNPPEQSLDTNSGMVSRLTQQSDGSWDHDVLVRGLPRSEENHAVNGLAIADGGDTLYVAVGGHTNQGAPGDKLSYLPEYALSAAILEVDVAQIENNYNAKDALDENGNTYADYYYDIPTLSPGQSNAPNGGPFGGLDGVNMGKLVDGGPVQVYSPGYRNPYDVVIRPNGDLYTIDNGHNGGWGDQPVGEGTDQCTNEINDGGGGGANPLHHIDQEGYYGGHANPTRANPDGANVYAGGFQDNAGELLVDFAQNSPVEVPANPVECDWQAPGNDGALTTFGASTNGLGVYTADNFGGALEGALLAASFDGNTYYTTFNSDGSQVEEVEPQFSTGLSTPLDVTALDDDEAYPGTVWVADFGGNDIDVYEPDDYGDSTGGGDQCTGADDASLDEDGDGYDNTDEIDAGTDPCSSSSTPADFDDDGTSNLNDPDDDNDGTPDTEDPFAIDPNDGTTTTAPVEYSFERGSEPGTILDLGFTGLMTNGQDDYQSLYDTENVIAGAAAPVLTIEDVPPGDAYQTPNDQQYAFQSGVQVNDEPLTVHTTLEAPFSSSPDQIDGFRSQGVYIGNGDQDNYIKLVVTENAQSDQTPGLELLKEANGQTSSTKLDETDVVGSKTVDLYIDIDPATDTATARYEITGNNIDGTISGQVGMFDIPSSWLDSTDQGMAFGVISTSNGAGTFDNSENSPYTATYTQLEVVPQGQVGNEDPTAEFTTSPSSPTAGEQVTFDASGSSDSDGSIASYSWDLDGDGQEDATGQTATTTFSSTGDKTVELTVTDDVGATATATKTVSVSEPSTTGEVQYRVNVGGPAITVDGGVDWSADTSGSVSQYLATTPPDGGQIPNAQPYTVGSVDASVPASTPTEIFQTERYDPEATPEMEWQFPVQQGATYEVRLHFHDGFDGTDAASERVFGVNIEGGEQELQDFDIIDKYGDNTAATETFTVTAEDDTLNVLFLHGQVENPQVNGIEVIKVADAVGDLTVAQAIADNSAPEDQIDLQEIQTAIDYWSTGSEVPDTGGETISLTEIQNLIDIWSNGETVGDGGGNTPPTIDAISDQTVTEGDSATVPVSTSDSDGDSLSLSLSQSPDFVSLSNGEITIAPQSGDAANSPYTVELTADDGNGGTATESFQVTVEEATGSGEVVFAANAGGGEYTASDGTTYQASADTTVFAGGSTTTTSESIANTEDDTLYQTELYGGSNGGPTAPDLDIPVQDGTYEVTLKFAEIFFSSNGQRVFDVSVEGDQKLNDYDIYAEAGAFTATDKTYTVEVTDGTLDIDFAAETDNAKLSAIKVVRVGDASQTTSADVTVNSGTSDIDASTFSGGSFEVTNTGDTDISSVTIDLSESVIPDAVFDPQGTAGDSGSKGLVIDSVSGGDGSVGEVSTADADVFSQPQNGQNGDDGYQALTVEFDDFNAGETVAFSVDIDPTTIKGVDTTGGEGSVSGLELSGSAVTVESSSATVSNDLFTDGSAGGSQSSVTSDASAAPTLGVGGVTLESTDFPNHAAASVSSSSQTLTLSGPAGATVELLAVEASAPPSDGYDVDAFEADNAEAVSTQAVTLDSNGEATVEVSLSESNLNYFQAAVQDGSGATGAVSQTVVLDVQTDTNTAPSIDAISDQTVVTGENVVVPVSTSDPDGDSVSLSLSQSPDFVTLSNGEISVDPASGDAGTYTVEVTADDGSATSTESFQLTVDTATATTDGTVVTRVNAGESTTLSATDGGPDWTGVVDTSSQFLVSVGDSNSGTYSAGDDVTASSAVPSSTPAEVYDAERYGAMTWEFDVTQGSEVEVRLYLSNQCACADQEGQRQYNVGVEGQQVLTEYDPVQDVGDDTGTVKAFTVTEDGDGTVTITFDPGAIENPQVNAIEIVGTLSGGSG